MNIISQQWGTLRTKFFRANRRESAKILASSGYKRYREHAMAFRRHNAQKKT